MSSLVYQIIHHDFDDHRVSFESQPGGTYSKHVTSVPISDQTKKIYLDRAVKFGKWCRTTYHSKSIDDCREHIQDYAN